MHSNSKEIYILNNRLFDKFFFLDFNFFLSEINLKISMKNATDLDLFIHFYFFEMLFLLKPYLYALDETYGRFGNLVQTFSVKSNILSKALFLNFLKIYFLSVNSKVLKNKNLENISPVNVSLKLINLNMFFSVTTKYLVLNNAPIQCNLIFRKSSSILNVYLIQLFGII